MNFPASARARPRPCWWKTSWSKCMARTCASANWPASPCPNRACSSFRPGTPAPSIPLKRPSKRAVWASTPPSQGKTIRLVLPELSTERRQEMVKITHKLAEDGRVAVRHVRRDAIEAVRKEAKGGGVAKGPGGKTAEKEIQKLTDQYIAKIARPPGGEGKRNHDGLRRRGGSTASSRS